jgi:hypothetical protein
MISNGSYNISFFFWDQKSGFEALEGKKPFENIRAQFQMSESTLRRVLVPDHDGGRPMEVNACILITHMVYL